MATWGMHDDTNRATTSVWLVGPRLMDRLATPPITTWGPVGASSAAWATAHIVAATSALLTISLLSHSEPWRAVVLFAWVLCTSGLVLRVAAGIIGGDSDGRAISGGRLSSNVVAGSYLVVTQLTFDVLRPLGLAAAVGFVGLVVITIGARAAGLDAWDGLVVPAGHYLRSVTTVRAIPPVLLGVGSAAAMFWLASVTIDRTIPVGSGVEWLVGTDVSRRQQFLEFMVATAVVALPALAVCEGIAAVARFHQRLHDLLAEEARQTQRAHFARRVHDRALGKIDLLYRMAQSAETRSLLVELEGELRLIQCDYRRTTDAMAVGQCLNRGLELANRASLQVRFALEPDVSNVSLEPDVADAVERSLLILVSNSVKAGAARADLELHEDREQICLRYADDAGGFDPSDAIAQRGGLFDLQQQLVSVGGTLSFEPTGHSTRSLVLVPA